MSNQFAPFPKTGYKAVVAPCPLTVLKTWVAIKLVDEKNKPIGRVKYIIVFPDGTRKEDLLDDDGYAFFSGIPHGDCSVGFPDFDPFWELVSSITVSTRMDPTLAGWVPQPLQPGLSGLPGLSGVSKLPAPESIRIQLLDEHDNGVPGEKFQIKLPNGDLAQGFLNPHGVAHVDGIIPGGDCQISFPDMNSSFVSFLKSE